MSDATTPRPAGAPAHPGATEHQRNEQQRAGAERAEQQRADQKALGEQQRKHGQELRERSLQEYQERMKGRPTPTQQECDEIKLGMNPELSDDGSGPDPNDELSSGVQHVGHTPRKSRQMEASSSGGAPYRTRS